MPRVNVDMSGASEFEAMPAGYYQAMVEEAKMGLSRASKPKLEVHFTVMSPEDYAGRKCFGNYSLQPQALWNLKRFLKALDLGYDLSGECEFDTDDLLGAECTLLLIQQEYQGEMRNSIQRVLPAGVEGETETPTEDAFEGIVSDW